jgi:hypothetical protein
MAYNFLDLVNGVNRRFNEVELDEDNFLNAVGVYSANKDYVNYAINRINTEQFEWPFNHAEEEELLTPEVTRYQVPYDCKTLDMDTFRMKRNNTLRVTTKKLEVMSYEDYLERGVDQEYNDDATGAIPTHVFRTPDMGYGLYPLPDKAYKLIYEYYRLPVPLILPTDVPTIPEHFRHVINEGAMYYAYFFRGDLEAADRSQAMFNQGISAMRSIYINRYDYLRSTQRTK